MMWRDMGCATGMSGKIVWQAVVAQAPVLAPVPTTLDEIDSYHGCTRDRVVWTQILATGEIAR
jgi:hypothetical protein